MEDESEKLLQLIREKVKRSPQKVSIGPKGVVVTYKHPVHLNPQEESLVRQIAMRTLKKSAEVEYVD